MIVDIQTGKIIAGNFPITGRRFVEQWRRTNIDRLVLSWNAVQNHKIPPRIKPLE